LLKKLKDYHLLQLHYIEVLFYLLHLIRLLQDMLLPHKLLMMVQRLLHHLMYQLKFYNLLLHLLLLMLRKILHLHHLPLLLKNLLV
jgi:hypothetical protein